MKRGKFFAVTILAAATALFAGCSSSSDSTPPQETQSAPDTFRKYSGNLYDPEFRAALRNSWVGTSGSNENRVMVRNDQQGRTFLGLGVSDIFQDMGKNLCEKVVGKGLVYGIDSAFGIQSKSQKQADETNFINNSLLGIQHQLDTISANLTTVYQNQTKSMSQQAIDQLQNVTDLANLSTTIFALSGVETTFNANYTTFIDDLQNTTNGAPDYALDFSTLCDSSFISNNYGNLDDDSRQNTILADAYNLMQALFGSTQNGASPLDQHAVSAFNGLITDSSQYMTDLKTATGINVVANYYAYGTRLTQAGFDIANILQQAYTVFAFTLQFASQCPAVQNFYSGADGCPGDIYEGIVIGSLTPDNLQDALKKLATNFNTQYVSNAIITFQQMAGPFGNGDTTSLLADMGVSLAKDFMQSGCFPLTYVNNANDNANLDYLAAECNYNGNWSVLQLYIPTGNGAEGLINIGYLNDFGLVGYIDDPVLSLLSQPSTIHSDGTCDSHYKAQCTSGFDDCYVDNYSIALNGSEPLYGSGQIFGGCGSFYVANPVDDGTGLNCRYNGDLCNCNFDDDSCTSGTSYFSAITSNGHVFAGTITNKYARNETVHDMFCTNVEFGVMSLTETGVGVDGNILSYPDGTQISANGPSQNPAGENGNTANFAEYGFGMSPQSTPQPNAASYPVCAEGAMVSLDAFYPDIDNATGTVTNATQISVTLDDSTGATGTFSFDPKNVNSTLTLTNSNTNEVLYVATKYSYSPSGQSGQQQVATDAMQGLWVYTDKNNKQAYANITCGNPIISGTVTTVSGNTAKGQPNANITLTPSGGNTQTTTTDFFGHYFFIVENGTYTVTPSSSGCTFNPPSTSVTFSGVNVYNVDFTAACQ